MKFNWSKGNEKMLKTQAAVRESTDQSARFVGFNIPQLKSKTGIVTCPWAGYCAEICYAGQGTFKWSNVAGSYEQNLANLVEHKASAASVLFDDLQRMRGITHVRIHDSGDFFSRWYYKAWMDVARMMPEKVFYGYTKSLPIMEWKKHPANFRFVQSFGGTHDHKVDHRRPHSRIFASVTDRDAAGYIDGNKSDLPAILGERKIGLVYHGNSNLTGDQLVQLKSRVRRLKEATP